MKIIIQTWKIINQVMMPRGSHKIDIHNQTQLPISLSTLSLLSITCIIYKYTFTRSLSSVQAITTFVVIHSQNDCPAGRTFDWIVQHVVQVAVAFSFRACTVCTTRHVHTMEGSVTKEAKLQQRQSLRIAYAGHTLINCKQNYACTIERLYRIRVSSDKSG